MSSGSRLLCSVGLREAENVTQCRNDRFKVKLGWLRQVGRLTKIVEVEKRGTTFNLSLHDGGRGDLEISSAEEMVAEALHHDWSHLQNLKWS